MCELVSHFKGSFSSVLISWAFSAVSTKHDVTNAQITKRSADTEITFLQLYLAIRETNKHHFVEIASVEAIKAYRVVEYSLLASGCKWGWVVSFKPRPDGKELDTRWIRSWEDAWVSQVALENRRISWPAGNRTTNLRMSRPWPSRYTLYTTSALNKSHTLVKRTLCYNPKVLIFAITSPSTVGDMSQFFHIRFHFTLNESSPRFCFLPCPIPQNPSVWMSLSQVFPYPISTFLHLDVLQRIFLPNFHTCIFCR